MKTHITKSKSGHYTVTIIDDRKVVVFKQGKIASLCEARNVAKEAVK